MIKNEKFRIRDFIYLDIERLKSIIAQSDQGLLMNSIETSERNKEVSGDLEGGLMGFIKASGGTKFLWKNLETETKTLHDHIYNKVEEVLVKNNLLVKLSDENFNESMDLETYRTQILESSFMLIKGKININDFTHMRIVIENFNNLGKFISWCAAQQLSQNTPKKQKDRFIEDYEKTVTLDKKNIDGFKLFFDIFYKDRVIIKILPFEKVVDFRFAGNLNKLLLRDDISSIIYKYGTAPVTKWNIFCQIAAIPPKDKSNINIKMTGSEIEIALQGLFDNFRDMETIAQSVVYPEISITPIAVYRE